eukprot:jgi/Botrbrau1/381/Bobra.110_2s0036.1
MGTLAQSSASNYLALLDEEDDALKLFALQSLNKVVHDFWFQIASSIASVEAFYEDEGFSNRELAALVASKVFYHLGELDDALTYALGAGNLFDINERSEYVQTILARCIDQYIELRRNDDSSRGEVDSRLTAIIERMFDRCYNDGQFEQAVGIALEAHRLDKLAETIQKSSDPVALLTYSLNVCQSLVTSREFRQQVLRLLVKLYESSDNPDWVSICQCLMFLDDAPEVAKILDQLLKGDEDQNLLAYQVGFDLFENEMQSFLLKVYEHLEAVAPKVLDPRPVPSSSGQAEGQAGEDAMETEGSEEEELPVLPIKDTIYLERYYILKQIIIGGQPIKFHLEFLVANNQADIQILKNMKASVEVRNSVCHSAVIFANAMMHCGTTVDTFLRENLEWLGRATNWAKFSATAGLGVIHRGHLSQGRALMAPYLPRNGASTSPYSEGGALYALGLIHASHGQDIREFLLESLRNANDPVIQHGACLGLGLAALGTNDEELFEDMKGILYADNAVAGEAAGLALGLLCVGSATEKTTELLSYAHETQHEKLIRGLAMGLALIMYGREEGAETLIEQMTRDQDPILRYGGMFVIGMAYRGTSNNGAIQKLLHFAVSDVSDDVRRAAVMNLGFVLLGNPEQCPRIVSLLSESFNPHVRYGAAMAVGVCCGGTGMKEALDLLEPMLKDAVDFVRQGGLIAIALVLMQQPEAKVAPFRRKVASMLSDKHEEVMCRMGAIMAAGLLDAGGRNVNLGLRSRSGYFRRTSVVGLAVFLQYWYWYPLMYFMSLALQPTALIGLDGQLNLPKFQVMCHCKPSLFAYPPKLTTESHKESIKMAAAVLSTTARKARKKEAAAKKSAEKAGSKKAAEKMQASGAAPGEGDAMKDDRKKEEPSSYPLDNPARVVPAQEQYISFEETSSWRPLKHTRPTAGFLMMKHVKPGEACEYVTMGGQQAPGWPSPTTSQPQGSAEELPEPAPPEPFDYVPS